MTLAGKDDEEGEESAEEEKDEAAEKEEDEATEEDEDEAPLSTIASCEHHIRAGLTV